MSRGGKNFKMSIYYYGDSLEHHGIKGQKWGVRRYQNPDGSLTEAGKRRYVNSRGNLTIRGRRLLKEQGADSSIGKHVRQTALHNRVKREFADSYNRACYKMDDALDEINRKYEGYSFNDDYSDEAGRRYIQEIGERWCDIYSKELISDFGPDPVTNGHEYVMNAPFMNMYLDF